MVGHSARHCIWRELLAYGIHVAICSSLLAVLIAPANARAIFNRLTLFWLSDTLNSCSGLLISYFKVQIRW